MIFQRKFDRALQNVRDQNAGSSKALEDEELSNKLEKGDTLAMILSALLVIVPAALLFLLIVAGIGFFFIAR